MAKVKTKWVCQECGYETPKYIGKCPDCNNWGTLVEEVELKSSAILFSIMAPSSVLLNFSFKESGDVLASRANITFSIYAIVS